MGPGRPPEDGELKALRSRVAELEQAAAQASADVRYLRAIDRVRGTAAGAEGLQQLLQDVLDELLELFACDRSWLLYPCDPDAPSWRVPMERARQEWPGAFALGIEVPMEEQAESVFREALEAGAPLAFDRTTERQVPEETVEAFGVRAQMVLAIQPHNDRPWLLGLHHCGTDHVWSAEEQRIFEGVGRHMANALDSMLLLRDLRSTEQQVARLQKMDAIGSLAGGVAHDFNNQLLVVLCYADMIREHGSIPDSVSEHAASVLEAAEKAADLTRQLLAFSRRSVLEPRVVDLCDLVESHASFLTRAVGPRVALELAPLPRPQRVLVDEHQIEQVLVNLVTNARDALPDGGTVRITLEARDLRSPGADRPPEVPPGEYVALSVTDDGVGMDEVTAARVFEPFFTTKEQGKGTGLGLSTAYGVARQSGGTISVESAAGQGTTFVVLLPRRSDAEASSDELRTLAGSRTGGHERILLVEGHEEVARVSARVLRSGGYRVTTVTEPAEALMLLEDADEPIDLMVTDVVMRGLDGVELARRAMAIRPGLRVSFTTGYSTAAIERLRMGGSSTRVLQKPYVPARLLEHVRAVLDG